MTTKENFWCEFCTCGAQGNEKNFTLVIESNENVKKISCPNKKKAILKHIGTKCSVGVMSGGVNTKGRSPKEREKRRSDDFKKNTLPTLGRDEQRHFAQKYKDQKK